MVYVVVALVNYSLVQSFVGSVASHHFSNEWGGKVSIASISCNPFNHLVLHNVELISPWNDTICTAGRIVARFDRFPIDGQGLTVKRVKLKDTYFHLDIDADRGLNMKYIFDYFATEEEKEEQKNVFVVMVDELVFDNLTYRQDLKETGLSTRDEVYPWVNIKHMEYRQMNGKVRNIRVCGGDVTCRIDNLTATERCGLQLRKMSSNIYVADNGIGITDMVLETADSRLAGDVLIDYANWGTMNHFMDSVVFTVRLDPGTYGSMRDAAYWTKSLWGMDERVTLSGLFHGPLADFRAENMKAGFGKESVVEVDATMQGLPNIDVMKIVADIHNLHTTYDDLASVRHPQGDVMKAVDIVKSLDIIDMSGRFEGTIYDFVTNLDLRTSPGIVKADVKLFMDVVKKKYSYSGTLRSEGFNISRVAPNEWVSRSGFYFSFFGDGFDPKEMNAQIDGKLRRLDFRDVRVIDDIPVTVRAAEGEIIADIGLDDAFGKFSVQASVNFLEDNPVYTADLDIEHFDMKRLGLWPDSNDTEARIYAHADGEYTTSGEGNTNGYVNINDLTLRSTTRNFTIDSINLNLSENNYHKTLSLSSDLVDGKLVGYLNWDGIPQLVNKFMEDYVPSLTGAETVKKVSDYDKIADANFSLNLMWKDTANLLTLVAPKLSVSEGTTFRLNYNFRDSFRPKFYSDSLRIGGLKVNDVNLEGYLYADIYSLRLTSEEIKAGSMLLCENALVDVKSSNQKTDAVINWNNKYGAIGNGRLEAKLYEVNDGISIVFDNSDIKIGGVLWSLNQEGSIHVDEVGWWIENLELFNENQSILVHATHHGAENDSVSVMLEDFDMSIINPFLNLKDMSASGVANGDISIGGLYDVPYLNAIITIQSLAFNKQRLGTASLKSDWNSEQNRLGLELVARDDSSGHEFMNVDGSAYLDSDETTLGFKVLLNDVGLSIIKPFVSSFSSKVDGSLSANLDVGGKADSPTVEGKIYLDSVSFLVDFLNVTFMSCDSIRLDEDKISLDDFVIKDQRGDDLVISGSVNHNHFNDISMDLSVSSDRFLCMNTTVQQSPNYYGTLVAEVTDGSVTGPINDISVVLSAQTLDGSSLNIPINDKRQAKQAYNIYFVSEDDEALFDDFDYDPSQSHSDKEESTLYVAKTSATESKSSRFNLIINVEATPDMEMLLPIKVSSMTADVKASGNGDLELSIGTGKPFSINGAYEMDDNGSLSVSMGPISKVFSIGDGSRIDFPGSIDAATFDIKAVHSLKTNLSSLTGSTSAEALKNINVQSIISMKGSLKSPNIKFDYNLPDADQSVKDEVARYIDRENDRDMMMQTINLLMLGKFYSSSGSSTEMGTTAATDGGYSLLFSTLGGIINEFTSSNLNINMDYSSGNSQTTDQYTMDLNYERGKFYLESTFGYWGELRELSQSDVGNNITGNMMLGYKINPTFHLFVFNRNTSNDYTGTGMPHKQGMGLKFTRDFDTFGDLFRKQK